MLISFGANVNSAVVDNQTPLYAACQNSHPECVDLMLNHGANLNAGDMDDARTPLIASSGEDFIPFGSTTNQFIDNRCRCMRSLLSAGAMIDQTDNDGHTALMYATWNLRLAEFLINFGANVNISDKTQTSILHDACNRDISGDVVNLLLERGANINVVNRHQRTPLHCACNNLYPAVVDSLLRRGADIDIGTSGGTTARQVALSRYVTSPNRMDVIQLMHKCAQTRLESSLADWIRLARNER